LRRREPIAAPAGTALNIVPDACTFEFEFRPLATDDVADARERLELEMRAVDPAARIARFFHAPHPAWPGTRPLLAGLHAPAVPS
jgi:acetylornithine deacetylase/succinyl-diaminopimelate desuccinylase-like protein